MANRARLTTPVGVALAALSLIPAPGLGQVGGTFTTGEAEAREMSMSLAVGCSPRRHNSVPESESVIQRDEGSLIGTATYFTSIDGQFIVLEEYDEELLGHCLVFGWFGGSLEAGSYRIRQLAYATVEQEFAAGDHSFFSMSAVRNAEEDSVFVIEAGTLLIDDMANGGMLGSFDVSGFVVEGRDRRDGVTWTGSFRALDGN